MKISFLAIACIALFASCNGNKKIETTAIDEAQTATTTDSRRIIEDVNQYFATFKPTEITTMVLGKEVFEQKFNPARTMDIAPTIVDFENYKVGAIVVPETAYETEIILDEVSIIDRKLVVNYSIDHQGEERTFTIVPVKLFQYSPQLSIDSVSFVNNDVTKSYAK